MQANGFTKPTSPTSTTNAQVARYAVDTRPLENKEKVKVNVVINLYGFRRNCV